MCDRSKFYKHMYVLFNIFVNNNVSSAYIVGKTNAIITLRDVQFQILEKDKEFNIYQPTLTLKLDNSKGEFNQEIINEIVLWKVNRYAEIDNSTLELINSIDQKSKTLDDDLTNKILRKLLDKATKGIQLPMASTILRFRNPSIYQIIDQRVFRIVYGESYTKTSKSLNTQELIHLYLNYLTDLRRECIKLNVPFESADRILYNVDKRLNRENKLNNYG